MRKIESLQNHKDAELIIGFMIDLGLLEVASLSESDEIRRLQ